MRIVQKTQIYSTLTGLLVLFLISVRGLYGQENYRVQILDIQRTIHKNWLRVPASFDVHLQWDVFQQKETGLEPVDLSAFPEFQVICLDQSVDPPKAEFLNVQSNTATLIDKKAGVSYAFLVQVMDGERIVAVSDTAWVRTGRMQADVERTDKGLRYWILSMLNGRVSLFPFGRAEVYDNSSPAGQVAFFLIWVFTVGGVIVLSRYCMRYLSLAHVFPMRSRVHFSRSYDAIYKNGISNGFVDILDQWKVLTESANDHIRQGMTKNQNNCVEDIAGENVAFWREKGASGIRDLKEKIQKYREYPVARIIEAGLENHELGGFRWLEVSREVDRAIENQAASELERLRRQSLLDWLWNIGTLAPLVGLFGTATGISSAFDKLRLMGDITQSTLVRDLSGGIFEALWTTILGLIIGIPMMLFYYYYQNKLNWIYSKWEEIYVDVTRKL